VIWTNTNSEHGNKLWHHCHIDQLI